MTSVWSYRDLADFRQFIRNLVNRVMSMSHALAGFREISMLPKRLGQLTVEEVSTKTELIEQIYRALKKMRPETRYKLPYDKKEREKEIIDNIAESFVIDKKNAHCKLLTGYHRDVERQFPYAIELALAPLKNSDVSNAGYVKFIGSVNDTPAIDGGEKYFQSDQNAYRWIYKKGEHAVRSAMDVLTSSGFDSTSPYTSRKRFASVAYVNVKTDVPDWLGAAGKTHMNQIPYAATIAKTLITMAHKVPSYHGQGFTLNPTHSLTTGRQRTATAYVDEFLKKRRKGVEADPILRIIDRLTQRGVAYRLRLKMMVEGFEPDVNWGTTME